MYSEKDILIFYRIDGTSIIKKDEVNESKTHLVISKKQY